MSSGKTQDMAVKLALQLASGVSIQFVCHSEADGRAMRQRIEELLRYAQVFPVERYLQKFSVLVPKKATAL